MIPALELLILVVWANAAPVLAHLILGHRLQRPLDGGRLLRDGQPLLGRSKTWRGVGAALLTTPLVAAVLGLSWGLGLAVAVAAMVGDILASFIKRRLGRPPSDSVLFLDQIPEALIPALIVHGAMGLSLLQVVLVVIAFTLIDLALTPAAKRLRGLAGRLLTRSARK